MLAHAFDSLLHARTRWDVSRWPPGARLLRVGDAQLRVLERGERGPTVLTVPDGPNVIEHHLPVIDGLAPHARVVCFDLPGFGYSRPPPSYRHRLRDGAAIVLGVMDALDIREASLLFSCANGLYAVAAARLAPARIRQLLLAQTAGLSAIRAWTARNIPPPVRVPVIGQAVTRWSRREIARGWYGAAVPNREQRAAFRDIAAQALDNGACYCLAGVAQGLGSVQAAELTGVRTRATLIWGDADKSHTPQAAETLHELLPQAEITHVPACGHFPDLEQPDRYVGLALRCLQA